MNVFGNTIFGYIKPALEGLTNLDPTHTAFITIGIMVALFATIYFTESRKSGSAMARDVDTVTNYGRGRGGSSARTRDDAVTNYRRGRGGPCWGRGGRGGRHLGRGRGTHFLMKKA